MSEGLITARSLVEGTGIAIEFVAVVSGDRFGSSGILLKSL